MIALMTSLMLSVIIISLACFYIAKKQCNKKESNNNPSRSKQRQKQHNKIIQAHIRNADMLCDQLRQLNRIKQNICVSYSLYKQILYIKTKMYTQTNLISIFTILEKEQRQQSQSQQWLIRSEKWNDFKEKHIIDKKINGNILPQQLYDNKIINTNKVRCFQEIFLNNLINRIINYQDQLLKKVKQITRIMNSEMLIVKVYINNENSNNFNKLMKDMIRGNYLELKDLLRYNVNLKQLMQKLNVQIDNFQQKLISDKRQSNDNAKYQKQYNNKQQKLNGRQLNWQNRRQQQQMTQITNIMNSPFHNNSKSEHNRLHLYNNYHNCINYNHKQISQTIKQSIDLNSQTLSFVSIIIQNYLLQIDNHKFKQLRAQCLCFSSNRSNFQRQPLQKLAANIQKEVEQLCFYYFNQQAQCQSQAFKDSDEIKQQQQNTNQKNQTYHQSYRANKVFVQKQQNQGQLNPISSDISRQLHLLINHLNLGNKQNVDAFSNRLLNQYQQINDKNQFQPIKTTTLQQLINAYQQQLSTINSKHISINNYIDKHTQKLSLNKIHSNQNNKIKIYKTQQNINQSQHHKESQKPSYSRNDGNYNQKQQQKKKINYNDFNKKQSIQTGQQIFSVSNRMKFIKQLDRLMVRNRIKKEHQELERKIKLKQQQQKQQNAKQIYGEEQKQQIQQHINIYSTEKLKESTSKLNVCI